MGKAAGSLPVEQALSIPAMTRLPVAATSFTVRLMAEEKLRPGIPDRPHRRRAGCHGSSAQRISACE